MLVEKKERLMLHFWTKNRIFAIKISFKSDMDITGRIIAVLEPRGGVSKSSGNPWKTQEFVIETHDQYPKKCVFEVFGEEKLQQMAIQKDEELTVSFDIDAREWNGRWFNSVRAWRIERVGAAPQSSMMGGAPGVAATPTESVDMNPSNASDDLPF